MSEQGAPGRVEKSVPNPAIFMFPITEFRVLETPAELAEWEEQMRDRFHLEVSAAEGHGHSHTYCVTGEKPGWDDSDTDDPF